MHNGCNPNLLSKLIKCAFRECHSSLAGRGSVGIEVDVAPIQEPYMGTYRGTYRGSTRGSYRDSYRGRTWGSSMDLALALKLMDLEAVTAAASGLL